MKKSTLTENKAEQTPTGGVLVGKREGQTIIHNKGTLSGYLVGKTHAEGGIKAVNKSTGQPLEMQGGEVVITAPAVSDNTKNEFNGKMMTNREILSTINEKGGGVSFAKGGDVPKNIKRTGESYKYGGKTMTDHEIYKHITGGHLADGMTLSQIAKKHKVSLKELQKQVDLGMKAESEHTSSKREQMKIVKDHLFENPKYYTVLKKAGLEDGGLTLDGFDVDYFETKRGVYANIEIPSSNPTFEDDVQIKGFGKTKKEAFVDLKKELQIHLKKYKHGGRVYRGSLVRDSKSGNTPARDLNNYNDMLDVEADGQVGGNTGLFGYGGSVYKSYARGGATDVTVDNWSNIPDNFKNVRLPKNIDWLPIPTNEGLYEIAKPFLSGDSLRPALQGMNFDDNGITFTNSHILLTIPIPTDVSYKGIYKKDGVKVDATYPKYENVIPQDKIIDKTFYIDVLKLLTYCKVAKNYSGKNEITFKVNDSPMSFNSDYIIGFLTSLIKLGGNAYWYVGYQSSKQALVFSKYDSYQLGKDIIGLIMPFVYEKRTVYGTEDKDKKAVLNVYFDFDDNVIRDADGIAVDLDVKPTKERAKRTPKTTTSQTIKQTSKFTAGEIKVFEQIDKIKDENSFYNVGITEWADGDGTNNFYAIDETGRGFMLRSYDKSLGVADNDPNKQKSKDLIKKYNDWKESIIDETITDEDVRIKKEILEFIKEGSWSLEKEIKSRKKDAFYDEFKEFYKYTQPPNIYTLLAIKGEGLYPVDDKTLKFLEKVGLYDDYEAPAGKFSVGEIHLFEQIDEIVKKNNISQDDFKSSYNFIKTPLTKDFDLVNPLTGEVFTLRQFNMSLGYDSQSYNPQMVIALINDYKNWKISTKKDKIEVFKLSGLSDDGTQVSDYGVYGASELLENLKLLENKFPERQKFPFRIYDFKSEQGSITFGKGIKTLPELEISIIDSPIFDDYDWTQFINFGKVSAIAIEDLFKQIDKIVANEKITLVVTDAFYLDSKTKDFTIINDLTGEVFILRKFEKTLGAGVELAGKKDTQELLKDYLEYKQLTPTATKEQADWKEKVSEQLKPKPSQTQQPKRNFDLERKYLSQRISDLAKELDLKKPILSNEEVAFYQREINSFILKLRKLNDAEMSLKPIEERVRGVYDLQISSYDKQYEETDMTSINSLKSQLTKEEYFSVRTPEFKSFFGDWETAYLNNSYAGVSKVINPVTKEPQPVFHGTNVLFVNWKTYETNNAHYFAVKREFSEFFATSWEERSDKAGVDSEVLKKLNPNRGNFLLRCFLDVRNPIDFSRFGVDKYPIREYLTFLRVNYNIGDFDFWTNITSHSGITQDTEVYAWQIIRLWQSFTKYVKVFTTYDGYIFYEYIPTKTYGGLENASLSYCAFDSNQIKFTNAYEFNALSNDSRFDLGGIL